MHRTDGHADQEPHQPAALRQAEAAPAATRHRRASATPQTRSVNHVARATDPALIRLLLREANRRGDQIQHMCGALDCTPGYISQLRTGLRKAEHVGHEFAHRVARYLGVPTALVKVISGRITMADFAWPQRSKEQEVADSIAALREDPLFASSVPDELFEATPAVQEFVGRLYAACSEQHPMQLRALPRALHYLQRAAMGELEFELELEQLRQTVSRSDGRPNKRH